ncbi:uncharacterized protein EI90DRAFT_3019076 [Cantharellus anzutake]|uniref:uncharacterized protein n=1 Tax=Cantharellus anzutake TaxID=1750568 RepID=UPI0019084C9A|nr:uncharacterized protein EI90DRAFT_3019076 [Cantharellus anzutake]KAF8325435.1 hypothetical protein EI90DRAFT_3019076 [Cantharellus anzutake]
MSTLTQPAAGLVICNCCGSLVTPWAEMEHMKKGFMSNHLQALQIAKNLPQGLDQHDSDDTVQVWPAKRARNRIRVTMKARVQVAMDAQAATKMLLVKLGCIWASSSNQAYQMMNSTSAMKGWQGKR